MIRLKCIVKDGTPYEGKLSRTVWSGGKGSDYFKALPITIDKAVVHVQAL